MVSVVIVLALVGAVAAQGDMMACGEACPNVKAIMSGGEDQEEPAMDVMCAMAACVMKTDACEPLQESMNDPGMGCACACPDMMNVEKDCEKIKDAPKGKCDVDTSDKACANTLTSAVTCINGEKACSMMKEDMNEPGTKDCIASAEANADGAQGLGIMGVAAALAFTVLV